jgi:photosystem II stability/assembly factor-like uncharacterized protein
MMRPMRGGPLALFVILLAGCSSSSPGSDSGGPRWPEARPPDRAPPDRPGGRPEVGRDLAGDADARRDVGPQPGWKTVAVPTSEVLRAVACFQGHVLAVGGKGTIVRKDALASSFAAVATSITAELHTVSFAPDGSYGAVAGQDSQIWQSKDQGQSFAIAPQCSAFVFDTFYSLHLHSATEGFGAGIAVQSAGGGYKYFAGASWVCGPSTYAGEVFHGVFRLAKSGWIVGATGGKIYRTEDEGQSWTTVSAGTGQALRGVAFAGALLGVAVGAGGAIVRATDGKGAVWSAVASPVASDLHAVHFVDTLRGWAVGAGGTILYSKDGGQGWSVQPSGTAAPLHGVCFTAANEGWAVGDGGVILHTTSGGL